MSHARDQRARISAKPGAKDLIYGPSTNDNILKPLYDTGGLMFPYTPTITDSVTVNYETMDPVHTNQPFAAFKSVAAKDITIIGTFTTQNLQEARTNIANIHFLRTITKMYFGTGGQSAEAVKLRGTPPPILMFNAYGNAMYHNIPVIVTTFNVELPQDIDYVRIQEADTKRLDRLSANEIQNAGLESTAADLPFFVTIKGVDAWLPTRFTIAVTMQVQNTPDRLRRVFNLNDFRTGKLITKGGWI